MSMKIAVMGAGAVGGYYGALLARAGRDVTFIARGPHLEAMRKQGLHVRSYFGDFAINPVKATDDPKRVGTVDLVLLTVKAYDIDQAARAIRPLVASDTVVLPLQNGVDAPQRTAAVVGAEHVMAGVTYVYSMIRCPGVIEQTSNFHRIVFGELHGVRTARAEAVLEVLSSTGATIQLSTDIQRELWRKFVLMAALGGVGTLTRLPVGRFRDVPETRSLVLTSMCEIVAVGRAMGIQLPANEVEQKLAVLDDLNPDSLVSMQRDMMAGRRFELESLVGAVVRYGQELGVPTPVNRFIYATLKPCLLEAQRS
jgi:2-dehydropantoate 2-reductase